MTPSHTHTHTHIPMMIIAPFLCRLLPLSTEGQSENNTGKQKKRHREKMIQLSKSSIAQMLLKVRIDINTGMLTFQLQKKHHTPLFPHLWAEE